MLSEFRITSLWRGAVYLINNIISYLFGVIVQLRVVFRKIVGGD